MYVPRVVNDNSCLAPYHKLFVSIHLHIDAQNFVDHMLRALIVITVVAIVAAIVDAVVVFAALL